MLGDDGRPFKTRAGDTVGLGGLARRSRRAGLRDRLRRTTTPSREPQLSAEERGRSPKRSASARSSTPTSSQNRTSDYVFSYDKMLAMNGNTATYMQYTYARVRSIFRQGRRRRSHALRPSRRADRRSTIRPSGPWRSRCCSSPKRSTDVVADYRPNHLTSYLFDLANRYSTFFEHCPVLKAETRRTAHQPAAALRPDRPDA